MSHDFNQAAAPVLIVPFVWIGDFVRCHSVVKLLRAQNPDRPVDIVSSTLCAPLADYMPGVRQAIVADLPRRRLGVALQRQLADQLREGQYGQALVMSRKWKAALAPWLAGIPVRTGFAGEFRFGLLNDMRFGERRLPRMIDQMGALALPKRRAASGRVAVARTESTGSRSASVARAATGSPNESSAHRDAVTGCGWCRQSVAGRHYAELARALTMRWRIGLGAGWAERSCHWRKKSQRRAGTVCATSPASDLRNAILALAAADVSVTNDSGLMHVSAAIGTPTVAIFGPTSPWHWKPLNPVAAILEPTGDDEARAARAHRGQRRRAPPAHR